MGKVAVVTGGGGGIGRGICLALGREGATVMVADVDAAKAESVAEELRAQGTTAQSFATDVSSLAAVEALADATVAAFGGVDVVCNNAGVYVTGPFDKLTPDDWRWVMSVNLDGVFHGCHVFSRLLPRPRRRAHHEHGFARRALAIVVCVLGDQSCGHLAVGDVARRTRRPRASR